MHSSSSEIAAHHCFSAYRSRKAVQNALYTIYKSSLLTASCIAQCKAPPTLKNRKQFSLCVHLEGYKFYCLTTFTGDLFRQVIYWFIHDAPIQKPFSAFRITAMSCASFWALWVYSWGLNPLFNDDFLCKIQLWLFWRCKGYERTSLATYNLIAGLQVCASSLGSMIAPPISGVITRTLGYPWNQTVLAFMAFIMVSRGTAIVHNRNK